MDKSPFSDAFEAFMREAAEDTILSSTRSILRDPDALYKVDLLSDDGRYRIVDGVDGGWYRPAGLLLEVPALDGDEYNDDRSLCSFESALDELRAAFVEAARPTKRRPGRPPARGEKAEPRSVALTPATWRRLEQERDARGLPSINALIEEVVISLLDKQ